LQAVDCIRYLHVSGVQTCALPIFYSGTYDDFEDMRRERINQQLPLKKQQDEQRRRIETFIARFKDKASKAAQARSRMKVLERMRSEERRVGTVTIAPVRYDL